MGLAAASLLIVLQKFLSCALACSGPPRIKPSATTIALAAPALHAETHVLAGHDNLALAWTGGCAPYALSVTSGGRKFVELSNLKRPQTRIDSTSLAAGQYVLSIRDAAGQTLDASLTVGAQLPEGPVALAENSNELDAVAYAAWLANHQDGRWRWESFQQLRPWIRQGGTLAGTYGDLVMWGDPSLDLADDSEQ